MPQSLKRTATQAKHRQASPEYGDNPSYVKRHSRTGKPLRSNAGKLGLPNGFVASDLAIENESDDSSFSDTSTGEGSSVHVRHKKKKKRGNSPPLRALSPAPPTEPEVDEESSSPTAPAGEVQLTFNVPRGHIGAFVVKLDLGSLSSHSIATTDAAAVIQAGSQTPSRSYYSPSSLTIASTPKSKSKTPRHKSRKLQVGFLDLPAELRNIVYRHVLVSKDQIDFRQHKNLSHSGALLMTCRTIHDEATEILYGDNRFKLARDPRLRGQFYHEAWQEIGWKDARRFLTTIGPHNVAKLRNLSITFEDPTHKDEDTPGYTDDEHLLACLKLLATYGRLENITLSFHGKTMLKHSHSRFLDHIGALKADQCRITADQSVRHRGPYGNWHSGYRNGNFVQRMDAILIARIERKDRLYGPEPED